MQITHPQNVFKKREKLNMSDDLVKQLRFTADDVCRCGTSVCLEAADRIEHLEDRCANLLVENGILNNRIEKLEAALRWICGSRTIEYLDGTVQADETKMLWTYRRIAREALEGIYDERIFKDPT
jgi:hypothetical protein